MESRWLTLDSTYLLLLRLIDHLFQIIWHTLLLLLVNLRLPAIDLVQLQEYAGLVRLIAVAVGLRAAAKQIDVDHANI